MRGMHSRKGKEASQTPTVVPPRKAWKLDWPLLLYPASILAALVLLYVVNHSIERGLPYRPDPTATQQGNTASGPSGQAAPATAPAKENPAITQAEPAGPRQTPGSEVDAGDQASTQGNSGRETAQAAAGDVTDGLFTHLKGPARAVAILRMAVEAKDHTRIKECMNELVALGDAAVVALNDLVNAQGEAGLWAAEALARIGTPMATTALLDTLEQIHEGQYKEDLGRRIAGISNHDSWPVLLDTLVQTGDAAVARAAGASLAKMADTAIVDEIVARYEGAATQAELDRLAQLVGSIQSTKASDALLSLAGDVTSAPQDSLQQAAIDALANVGDAQSVSHLLRRLEATTPGEGTGIYNAITRIRNPDARAQLLYAAAGNKEVSAEYGRSAAIQALANYPSEETIALLERIVAQEANERVVSAASRTLDEIRRAPHVITAKAETLKKSEEMLPIKPLVK